MKLVYEFYIKGSAEKLWEALTSPEETKKVYFGSSLQSMLEAGAPLSYVGPGKDGDETVHIYGTILEIEPYRSLVHTSNVGKAYTNGDSRYQESRVSYQLEPMGGCTKLTVVQDQWAAEDPAYENTAKGWWILLSGLKTLIETGAALEISLH